jgi:hypothetical protein
MAAASMSVHTLTVDASTTEPTEVWFAVYGANVNLDDDGRVISILDAAYAALISISSITLMN